MIRFVYIGDQITMDTRQFFFYNTITDEPLSMHGNILWDSVDDFVQANKNMQPEFDRCMRLIPDWYKEGKDMITRFTR